MLACVSLDKQTAKLDKLMHLLVGGDADGVIQRSEGMEEYVRLITLNLPLLRLVCVFTLMHLQD